MATAVFDNPPTPTSLSLIRADFPPIDSGSSAQTNHELIEPLSQLPEPDLAECDRFRIVNLHAAGGQGQVFVARDEQLRRDVALKELKPKHANRTLSRARFLREAEIAGGLEHPGVVPVYALGKHMDGRPFYAMRLIKGRTMHECIREYHRPQTPITQVERNVRFRQLLQRFISVCQTIAYAHSRGIVHRDIKPSNVLIGDFGEAIVVDWGLARRFNELTGCVPEDENPSYSNVDMDSRADSTMMGSALGTPAFMSPEQAEGRWDQVGPASDVYSLGATLYVLLTGHLPLKNLPWTEMSRRIRAGEIPSARQVTPWVSRGLDAICSKAMSVNPAKRYATAKALAEDIEHWLADEPVQAAPEPYRERVRRWIRRHRMFVTTMAAILVVTSIALGVGLFFVDKERNNTQLALDIAKVERKNTSEALEELTSRVIDQWLSEQEELRPEHRAFLEKALVKQKAFAEEKPEDPMGQLGVVRAYRRVGEIQMKLGKPAEGHDALVNAQKQLPLVALPPDSLPLVKEQSSLHSAFGNWNRTEGRFGQAEADFAEARRLWEKVASTDPDDPEIKKQLAYIQNNHGIALTDARKFREAAATFSTVLEHREREANASPDSRVAQRDLGLAQVSLGNCLLQIKNCSKALEYLKAATDIGRGLANDVNAESEDIHLWADGSAKLGRLYLMQWQLEDADVCLTNAANSLELLVSRHPSKIQFAQELAEVRCNLAMIEYRRKRWNEAIKDYDLAAIAVARAQKSGPPSPRFVATISGINESKSIARAYRAMDNLKDGKREEALKEIEELLADKNCSATTLYNSACVYCQAGLFDKSLELLKRVEKTGYFAKDPAHVTKFDEDDDLAPLRERPEYKAFRATLPAAPPSPSKK